ncbi:hypothetical protein CV102_12405 [Natronococcus pandeyae]|uniref:Uncharacterized protein n=1 Tax=Natronococcus pandeyae TaxID=2055836 RepID=A0A8J8Q1B6_9EURY|nr:hypothetical protein [Natronococcus pandeyae]TYL38591.1 hypothetical protein CV102_12405 [Natronococcus pandeyae]
MSLVTPGGIVPSIVPFDPTIGITAVATVMLALFVIMMVFPAVAPLFSSTWGEQLDPSASRGTSPEATDADADSEATDAGADSEATDAGADSEAHDIEAGAGSTSFDEDEASGSMSGTFTNEEIGKLVERADGKVIGTVASASGETAHVEPKPDAIDQILIRLDRKETGGSFTLEADSVREISDTRVHLERDFVRPTDGPTTDANADDVSAATE